MLTPSEGPGFPSRPQFSCMFQFLQPVQSGESLKSLPLSDTLYQVGRCWSFAPRIAYDPAVMSSADLNPSQWEAVNYLDGPLLVLAGPGSGKTRVISRRIVRLIEEGVAPGQILAITFTNKAAGEMASRVAALLPGRNVWVSTFHRLCARLLRRDAAAVGLQPNFTILDTADQAQLVKGIMTDLNEDSKHYKPGRILHRISQAKYHLQTPEAFSRAAEDRRGNALDQLVAGGYTVYERMR